MSFLVVNPLRKHRVDLAGRSRALAADFTTPWAFLAARARDFAHSGYAGLVHPTRAVRPPALYAIDSYDPRKYALLLIHGLQSTPLAFADLVNEIRGDPQLRERYQIWQYSYPTGTPVLFNSAEMRRNLTSAIHSLNRSAPQFATNHIVVLGHSLGGLLAHTLVSSSGAKIWDSMFTVSPGQLRGDKAIIKEVERFLFFERNREVVRAIFIATPHRGSPLADGLIGRFGHALVMLPDTFTSSIAQLAMENRDHMVPSAYRFYRAGKLSIIRALSPKNNVLKAIADLPVAVPFNSIIGQHASGPVAAGSDGVVPYASSHLDGAESELVIRAGHSAYESPAAIADIRRILHEVLSEPRSTRHVRNSFDLTKVKPIERRNEL
jgi:hypothetical protein